MINVIPTPKKYEIIDEAAHKIELSLYTDVAKWKDPADAFCESFFKIFETELPTGKKGGIELVFDASVKKDAYKLNSAESVIISASDKEDSTTALQARSSF